MDRMIETYDELATCLNVGLNVVTEINGWDAEREILNELFARNVHLVQHGQGDYYCSQPLGGTIHFVTHVEKTLGHHYHYHFGEVQPAVRLRCTRELT